MTYAEAKKAWQEECEEIAEQCEAEGYPARGSNYELRAAQAWEYWAECITEE